MKTHIDNLFVLSALIAGFVLIPSGRLAAQTFTTLYPFTAPNPFPSGTNSDGAYVYGGLVLSGNTLYGTADQGGSSGNGTVFAVNTDGTDFTNLHNFTATSGSLSTNGDGSEPDAGLILSGDTLYGTTYDGGTNGNGTVFAVKTDGTSFTNLYSFTATSGPLSTNNDGANPDAGLFLSGNTLYGTASAGGSSGNGTVFAINTDGTSFTNLHSFTATSGPLLTNRDGTSPQAGLILTGNTLYGTASAGGSSGLGTVFAVTTSAMTFTTLFSFTNGSDGANPYAGLILSGDTLYGTAEFGGTNGTGTVFAISTNGTRFTVLHAFTSKLPYYVNDDGANPDGGLILSGNTLYGTAYNGGTSGNGTVFALNTDGTNFATLHNFTAGSGSFSTNSDGADPYAGLILSGDTLYGTAVYGGSLGGGTVFGLSLERQLTITPSGTNVILTWPTNVAGFSYAGFTLQSATNLAPPVVWSAVSPLPVVVNGLNTVTNPLSGPQRFYQLSLPVIPSVMALIPTGPFTMGDTLDGENNALPTNITVSAFYMDVNLMSYSQWQNVYAYATLHGYGFDHAGSGKAANQPVQTVDWYDCVKWSNARSQQAGLTPVYYTDAGFTQVYTNGELAPYVDWSANGYRLPTEAEWEKAARGGLSGQRFPWGDTISESQANYDGFTGAFGYDLGPSGYNSIGIIGGTPYTSPVESFAPNGYGLYDMAGNVFEWCWDWYGTPYGQPTATNPTGPGTGSYRVQRGGDWTDGAFYSRCAGRNYGYPGVAGESVGFRCVRGL